MSEEIGHSEERLAHLLALALNLEPMLYEQVMEIATKDQLTGAYNLAFFRANLENELKRANMLRYPLALLLIDIEPLEGIEQEFQIMASDLALEAVSNVLAGELRVTDWLARSGSEEFALVLPGCPPNQLDRISNKLLDKLTSINIALPNQQEVELQVHLGGSVYVNGRPDADELLNRAEAARVEARSLPEPAPVIQSVDPWARAKNMAGAA